MYVLFTYSTKRIIQYGLVFPLMLVLVVSLALNGEYSKGQSMIDVTKFSTRPDIGIEDEPTINDDAEEEETIEDDEAEPEPTDEEKNDTVTSVPPKRPTGANLGLDNLTTAPLEEPGKLIFASCKKNFPHPRPPGDINYFQPISCNVPGATPGDNVVVSSTRLDGADCNYIASSQVSEPNVVSVRLFRGGGGTAYSEGHNHPGGFCDGLGVKGTVIFSIIVFRPEVPDIIGSLEELRD